MRQVLRVELNRERGGSVYLSASPSDCVSSIKLKLEAITGIPTPSQTLYHASNPLTDTDTLRHFSDTFPVTTLYLHIRVRGGASRFPTDEPLEFVEQNQAQFLDSLAASEHCTVKQGVNIVTKCSHGKCELGAVSSEVILQKENYVKHLGYCSVRSELLNMNCPLCGLRIPRENFDSFAFVDCTVVVEWRMKDGEDNSAELAARGDTYQLLRLTSSARPYEYIDFRVRLN